MKTKFVFFLIVLIVSATPVWGGEPKKITVVSLNRMLEKKSMIVIYDLRTPGEQKKGIIPGAIIKNFYDKDFDSFLANLDKNKKYVFYCASGTRSYLGAKKAVNQYKINVKNLTGGMVEWTKKFPQKKIIPKNLD